MISGKFLQLGLQGFVNGNVESLFLRHWNEIVSLSRHTLEAILRWYCSQQLNCHLLRDSHWILFLACPFSVPFLECSFWLWMTCPAWPLSSLLPLFFFSHPQVDLEHLKFEGEYFATDIGLKSNPLPVFNQNKEVGLHWAPTSTFPTSAFISLLW